MESALVNAGHCTVTLVSPFGMIPMSKPSGSSTVMSLTARNAPGTWLLLVAVTVALYVVVSVTTDRPVGAMRSPAAASVAAPYVVLRSWTVLIRTNRH